jgi:amino acid transporter
VSQAGASELHSSRRSDGAPSLDRALGLRDLVLFNLVAVLGLRWLATAAKAGPSALTLWLLAALLFFVPQGLVVTELSSRFPEEGGIYQWTKRALGERHGYLCGWCYWINNVLYYPNLLISSAVIATYAIGRGDSALASSWTYVLSATLACLWFAVVLNIVGVGTGKWLQNAGGIGSYIPGVILIGLGAHSPSPAGRQRIRSRREPGSRSRKPRWAEPVGVDRVRLRRPGAVELDGR